MTDDILCFFFLKAFFLDCEAVATHSSVGSNFRFPALDDCDGNIFDNDFASASEGCFILSSISLVFFSRDPPFLSYRNYSISEALRKPNCEFQVACHTES